MLRACVQVTERFRGNMPHVRSLEQCVHSRDERCLDQHLRDVINSRVTSSGTPALVGDDTDTCVTSRDIRVSIVYVIKTSLTSLCTPVLVDDATNTHLRDVIRYMRMSVLRRHHLRDVIRYTCVPRPTPCAPVSS